MAIKHRITLYAWGCADIYIYIYTCIYMYLLKCSALLQFNGSATAIASQEESNSAEVLMSPKGMKTKPVVLLLSKTNTQSFLAI